MGGSRFEAGFTNEGRLASIFILDLKGELVRLLAFSDSWVPGSNSRTYSDRPNRRDRVFSKLDIAVRITNQEAHNLREFLARLSKNTAHPLVGKVAVEE